MKRMLIIGSGKECDVVIADPRISPRHCQVVHTGHGWVLTDLNSAHGTYVNGIRVASPIPLNRRNEILLGGSVPFPWHELPAVAQNALNPVEQQPQQPIEHLTTIGREETCDMVIDEASVSRQHARLVRIGQYLFLEDLNSANGTFLNGQRFTGRTPVRPGDRINLGNYALEVQPDGRLAIPSVKGTIALEVREIAVDVTGRRLLQNISLSIFPGEFVGLMGPSGVGKTTLMNVMNGYLPPSHGRVFINGVDLYQHYSQFGSTFGYVPQDDIMHRELTVNQALYYTARLRLPAQTSDEEIVARIQKIVAQLGLESTLNTLIGSPERKGIKVSSLVPHRSKNTRPRKACHLT